MVGIMFKSVLLKDLFREIWRTKSKFISIICMIMLGIFVSVGMKITSPIMKNTVKNYMNDTKLYDIVVTSVEGIDNDLKEKILNESYIKKFLYRPSTKKIVENANIELKINAFDNKMTVPILIDGNYPKNETEIVLDNKLSSKYKIGQEIVLIDHNDTKDLKNASYKIVGFVNSIEDIVYKEYSENSENYFKSFAYVDKNAFNDVAIYNLELKVTDDSIDFDSEEYKKLINDYEKSLWSIVKNYSEDKYIKNIEQIKDKEKELQDNRYILRYALNNSQYLTEDKIVETKKSLKKVEDGLKDIEKHKKMLIRTSYDVYTRYNTSSYSFYESGNKLNVVSNVFSGFFFLVATLVSLTTMIRMVEEHRIQIGTLKALGYTNSKIAMKFFVYGSIASTIGIILGLIIAHTVILRLVFNAHAKSYIIPDYSLEIHPFIIIFFSIVAYLCTAFTALVAVYEMLKSRVSELLRAKTPKMGERVLLEKVKFLWKRMNFFRKVTARNIFRYKARMWMTMLGIAGCTGLLLLGFCLRRSVQDIEIKQYENLFNYDLTIGINPYGDVEKIKKFLSSSNEVQEYFGVYVENVKIRGVDNNIYKNIQAYISDDFSKLIKFQGIYNNKLNIKNGALMTVKLSHISKSSELSNIDMNILGKDINLKIDGIIENYIGHSVFIDKEYFESRYGEVPYKNAYIVKLNRDKTQVRDFIQKLYTFNDIFNIDDIGSNKIMLSKLSNSMNSVIWVMVICSIFLAIVVLYNLTNINISERNVELSTIKVLGMYSKEITMYVYRETLLLTIFGQILGLILGIAMFKYVVWALPPETAFIGIGTNIVDYIGAILITFIITLIISIPIHFKLKKVNMVEALKAVE